MEPIPETRHVCLAVILLLSATFLPNSDAFNVEDKHPIWKRGPQASSLFGASLAFHASTSPIGNTGRILVGAPRANWDNTPTGPGTFNPEQNLERNNPGSIYECTLVDNSTQCTQRQLDTQWAQTSPPPTNTNNRQVWWPLANDDIAIDTSNRQPQYLRSNGFFGLRVMSAAPGDNVMACGPLVRSYIPERPPAAGATSAATNFSYVAGGACIRSPANLATTSSYELFRFCTSFDRTTTYADALCNAGVGMAVVPSNRAGPKTIISEVGASNSRGRINSHSVSGSRNSKDTQASLPTLRFSESLSASGGFSITYGELGTSFVHFISAPKAESSTGAKDFVGRVHVLDSGEVSGSERILIYRAAMIGTQMGEQFGFALAAGRFRRYTGTAVDLAVGAPFYTDLSLTGQFNHGRVYVYGGEDIRRVYMGNNGETAINLADVMRTQVLPTQIIDLKLHRALFGYALTNGGDMNGDGFQELVVGSPGVSLTASGNDRTGAVYIYYGRPEGLDLARPQIIYGSRLSSTVTGFGFSVTGGELWDMDSNGYTDVAASSLMSQSVFYLKSRPVVQISATFTTYIASTSRPGSVDIDRCNGTTESTPCFVIRVCYHYYNFHTSTSGSSYTGNVVAKVFTCEGAPGSSTDCVTEDNSRLISGSFNKNETITIQSNTVQGNRPTSQNEVCMANFSIILRTQLNDRLAPFNILTKWFVEDQDPVNSDSSSLTPIGTRYGDLTARQPVPIVKDCASQECHPDLYVNVTSITWPNKVREEFTLGTRSATINILVGNRAEPASTPTVTVNLPSGVTAFRLPTNNVQCNGSATGTVVECTLPNPFVRDRTIDLAFTVLFDTSVDDVTSFLFNFSVTPNNASTPEFLSVSGDNDVVHELFTDRRASFRVSSQAITAVAVPLPVGQITTPSTVAQVGPQAQHRFSVLNSGPSALPPLDVEIRYPAVLRSNQAATSLTYQTALLYLSAVEAESSVNCSSLGTLRNVYQNPPLGEQTTPVPSQGNGDFQRDCPSDVSFCYFAFTCRLPRLAIGRSSNILMTWRVSNTSLAPLLPITLPVSITVQAIGRETNFALAPGSEGVNARSTINLDVTTPSEASSGSANIGIIIGCVIGGVVVIIVIIAILYKAGFFKRTLHEQMMQEGGAAAAGAGADENYELGGNPPAGAGGQTITDV